MPLTISRLFNFVNDKSNGIPITSSRVDAELNQLVATQNEAVIVTATTPASPFDGMLWFNLNTNYLEEYRNNEWIILGPVHVSTSVMATPENGDIWYNPTTYLMQYYNSSADSGSGGWIALARWALGASIASASTITLGTDGNIFQITGTTNITSITAGVAGQIASLYFANSLTIVNGSNLFLNGDLIANTNTIIHLISNGTNWYEISRTPNAPPYIKMSLTEANGINAPIPVPSSWQLYPINIKDIDTFGIGTLVPIYQFTVSGMVTVPTVGATYTNNTQIFTVISAVGSLYQFTFSGVSVAPTQGSVYTNNGHSFTIVSTSISGGSGIITASGTGTPSTSGTLTNSSGIGDTNISFSAESHTGGAIIANGTGAPTTTGTITKTSGTGDNSLNFSLYTILGNEISLPEGTYKIKGHASFYETNGAQIRLYNITNSGLILTGLNAYAPSSTGVMTTSFLAGEFTITATNTIAIQYQIANAVTDGLGVPINLGTEVYGQFELEKVG